MSDILSQDEVDALLKGVQSGDIDTQTAGGGSLQGMRPYDFTSQERIIRGRMPGLEISNERFTRLYRNSMANLLMRFVDSYVSNVEITKFGEFMKTVPFPSSINVVEMEPLKGYSLLVFEAPLVFALVEFFFGGASARHTKSEGRSFTAIEQRVIKKMVGVVLNDMASAWSGLLPIQPRHVSSEMNPQFVTIVTPSEIVLKTEVNVEIEDFTGKLFLCFPYSVIEPIKEKLYSGIRSDKYELDQRWVTGLKSLLLDSHVEVSAELGSAVLTFEEVMNLKEGQVICLNRSVTDDLCVKVEGAEKFRGLPGHVRGSQGIRITRTQ